MKRLVILSFGVLLASALSAQQYSYNHDPMKQAQITVMESGTGSLTPAWYYNSLHQSYARNAATKNKTQYRLNAGGNLYVQKDYAETIDSAMTRRATIEALNMADRAGGGADLAWKAEGPKLEAKMNAFISNINRIIIAGGTPEERNYWLQYYNVYHSAIQSTQDAYMPNAQRKREYLQIHSDVTRKNELLVRYLVRLQSCKEMRKRLSQPVERRPTDKTGITDMALARWQLAAGMSGGHIIED